MFLTDRLFRVLIHRAPSDAAGAPPPVEAPGATPGAADDGNPTGWAASLDPEIAAFVTAKGLTGKPVEEALRATLGMYRNAETALGKRGIPEPDKGQDLSQWLAANRERLGLPNEASAYGLEAPEGFAADLWDGELATKAAEIAHANGVPPSAHQAYVKAFMERQQALDTMAENLRSKADAEMRAALEKDFGKDLEPRLAAARQAAQRVAEMAGVDSDGLSLMGELLAAKTGAAPVIRMFDQIARMMADDTLPTGAPGGTASDAASAQAQLNAMRAPGGAYYEAVAKGDQRAVRNLEAEIERLTRLAVGEAQSR